MTRSLWWKHNLGSFSKKELLLNKILTYSCYTYMGFVCVCVCAGKLLFTLIC